MPPVWAFGGGKGGVGKSLVCAAVGSALARRGQRVVALDLDLGAANLHTLLGVLHPPHTLDDFLSGREGSLAAACVDTEIPGLRLVSGAAAILRSAHPRPVEKRALAEAFLGLDADVLLIDLGAGTQYNTLDFFNLAGVGVAVTSPEPTSIQNAYAFLKAALFRRVESALGEYPWISELLLRAAQPRGEGRLESVGALVRAIGSRDETAAEQARTVLEDFRGRLVINQAGPREERRVLRSLNVVSRRYLDLELPHAGTLPDDPEVPRAVRRLRPTLLAAPDSPFSLAVETLVDRLLETRAEARPDLLLTAPLPGALALADIVPAAALMPQPTPAAIAGPVVGRAPTPAPAPDPEVDAAPDPEPAAAREPTPPYGTSESLEREADDEPWRVVGADSSQAHDDDALGEPAEFVSVADVSQVDVLPSEVPALIAETVSPSLHEIPEQESGVAALAEEEIDLEFVSDALDEALDSVAGSIRGDDLFDVDDVDEPPEPGRRNLPATGPPADRGGDASALDDDDDVTGDQGAPLGSAELAARAVGDDVDSAFEEMWGESEADSAPSSQVVTPLALAPLEPAVPESTDASDSMGFVDADIDGALDSLEKRGADPSQPTPSAFERSQPTAAPLPQWASAPVPGLSSSVLAAMAQETGGAAAAYDDFDAWGDVELASQVGLASQPTPEPLRDAAGMGEWLPRRSGASEPGREPGDPLRDPPNHEVVGYEEEVDTPDGRVHVQTTDLAPTYALIRTAIYDEGRLIGVDDHGYEDLLTRDGVAIDPALIPGRVAARHRDVVSTISRGGVAALSWPERPSAAISARGTE